MKKKTVVTDFIDSLDFDTYWINKFNRRNRFISHNEIKNGNLDRQLIEQATREIKIIRSKATQEKTYMSTITEGRSCRYKGKQLIGLKEEQFSRIRY